MVRVGFEAHAMIAVMGPNSKETGLGYGDGHNLNSRRIPIVWRVLLLIPGFAGLAVWALAVSLVPSPNHLGTHTQLGLPECPTMVQTGYPCPTCGMTTAAAWLARGHIRDSLDSNPAGLPIFSLAIRGLIWLGFCSLKGQIVVFEDWDRPLVLCTAGLFSIALTTWAIRLCQITQWPASSGP